MVRWSDSVTGLNLNTFFDAEGNRVRAFTDTGYDPLGQNTSANPNYRTIDHVYTFDAARRVTQEVQRTVDAAGIASDSLISGFGYDAANNRITWNNQGTVVSYTYDANHRAVQGDFVTGGNAERQAWTYDAMGNVLSFSTLENGVQKSATVTQYNDANRSVSSDKDGQVTTQAYDRSLRITQTVLRQSGKTYYYNHSYFGDGREQSIAAFGDAFGNSTSTYDADKSRSSVNLGQGDSQSRPEVKSFVADNEGHLLFQFHDDGKSGTNEMREYAYANGNPVGETGNGVDGAKQVLLDSGAYSLIQNLGDSFPGGVLSYTTRDGDTLQGIASQMYGNASLWFVIADANGLNAGESLKAGKTLTIPNSVKTGNITADNHRVYSESEIVGSTLPNLKTPPPPPPSGGCGGIIMIIIIVVIAVVASIVTAGASLALLGYLSVAEAVAGAGLLATVVTFAVVGAVVAAIGSIIQQGLFIALGYQDKFSWKQVGHAAVVGAISGAASAVGGAAQAAEAAEAAGKATEVSASYLKIATAALKVTEVATKQLLDGGKITSWTSLASAAVSGYLSAEVGNAQETVNAAEKGAQVSEGAYAAAQSVIALQHAIDYVTPWVQLAETYVRNDHKLTPMDWANAAGSTLSQAVANNFGATGEGAKTPAGLLENGTLRLGTNLLVAGALSHYDRDAAKSYFDNSVGQEVGQFIGNYLGLHVQSYFAGLASERQQERMRQEAAGVRLDQNGNPAPVRVASLTSGNTMSDAGSPYAGVNFGEPVGPTPESEAMLGVMANELQNGAASTTGKPIMLDDFGQPIPANKYEDPEQQAAYDAVIKQGKDANEAAGVAELVKLRRQVDALNERIASLSETDYLQAAQLEKVRNVLTDALISKDVYYDGNIPGLLPKGVTRLSDTEVSALGINPEKLSGDKKLSGDNGYFAALYRNENTASYVLANRGTEMTHGNDWWTNFAQEFGFAAPQYKQAVQVGQEAFEALKAQGETLSFTGHSLGGGLASAQALATGAQATTFNAAGLSAGTIARYNLDTTNASQQISAYYVNGEILSRLQDNPVFDVIAGAYGTVAKNTLALGGVIGDLAAGKNPDTSSFGFAYVPEAAGNRLELPAVSLQGERYGVFNRLSNTVSLHLMDYVLKSLQTRYGEFLGASTK